MVSACHPENMIQKTVLVEKATHCYVQLEGEASLRAKISDWDCYFETEQKAYEFIVDKLSRKREFAQHHCGQMDEIKRKLKREIESLTNALQKAKALAETHKSKTSSNSVCNVE